jgi:hypothetical protein
LGESSDLAEIFDASSPLSVDQPELDTGDAPFSGSFITGELVSGDLAETEDS